jgi:hypothetical protein
MLSSLLIVVSIHGSIPAALPGMRIVETGFIGVGKFTRVTNRGFPLIFVMLLYHLYGLVRNQTNLRRIAAVALLAAGAIITFYRALWIGIVAALVAQVCVEGKRGMVILVRVAGLVILGMLLTSFFSPTLVQMVLQRAESSISEIQNQSGSYQSRIIQIQTWLPVLREHWVCGVGFLHPDSKEGQALQAINNMQGTGTLDVGWIDLLGRLGVVGTLLLAAFLLKLSGKVFSHDWYTGSEEIIRIKRTVFSFLIVGVISLPGAALLSWEGGSIMYGLLLGLLLVLEDRLKYASEAE